MQIGHAPVDGVLVGDQEMAELVSERQPPPSNLVLAVDQTDGTLAEQNRAGVRGVHAEVEREGQESDRSDPISQSVRGFLGVKTEQLPGLYCEVVCVGERSRR